MGWVRLSRPSLVTGPASDPARQQARVVQTSRAVHRAKVIKLPSPCFLSSVMKKCRNKRRERRPYLAMMMVLAEMEMKVMVFRRMLFFPLLLCFFVMGCLFLWFFFCSPFFCSLFLSVSPLPFSLSLLSSIFLVSRAFYL